MNTFVTTESASRVVVDAADRFQSAGSDYVHGAAVPAHEPVDDVVVDERPVNQAAAAAPVGREVAARGTRAVRVRRTSVLTLDQLVDRNRSRARHIRRARALAVGTGGVLLRTGRGAGRVLVVTGRGTWRWVWMPEVAELVARLADGDDPDKALRRKRELSSSRRTRAAGTVAGLGAAGLTTWLAGPELLDAVQWWGWGSAGLVAAAGCWLAGRVDGGPVDVDVDQAPARDGLQLSMSERQVRANLREHFAELKIRATVVKVHAHPWGWQIELELTTLLTETHVAALALLLDTRRGGLILSGVAASERSRVMNVVLRDLLPVGQAAEPIALGPHQDIHTPVKLANRFDGAAWMMRLAGRHLLLIGSIGSGKSTGLHKIIDVLLHGGAVVGGIDLSGGADLRAWEPAFEPRLSALGDLGGTVPDAATALSVLISLIRDRKARLGPNERWRSTRDDPPVRIVIDEAALVTANSALLELVGDVALYGRHADCHLILANHGLTNDLMGDARLKEATHTKLLFAMDLAAAKQLPKELRDAGVAPGLLIPATPDEPNDAGKCYVTGVGPLPFLARFDPYQDGEASRRAHALVAERGRPRLSAADERAVEAYLAQNDGVPKLLLDAFDAVRSFSHRDPARATSEEIAAYLRKQGHDVTTNTLTVRLREELGAAYPAKRKTDMNLGGKNPKGWTLDDLDAAITEYQRLNAQS